MADLGSRKRINLKAALILVLVAGLVGGGAAAAYKINKRVVARRLRAEGKAALEQQDWAAACKSLKEYLRRFPDDEEMLEGYARASLAVRPKRPDSLSAAIGAYRRLLRYRRGDARLCDELARLYHAVGEYGECVYVSRLRLEVEPGDVKAALWLGRALTAQHKNGDATTFLTGFIERHPEQIEAYVMLSDIACQDDTDAAREAGRRWLDEAVERNPQSAEALARRAWFDLHVSRDAAAARGDLEHADQLQPEDPRVRLQLAEGWLDQGQLDRAEVQIRAAESLTPELLTKYDVDPDEMEFTKFKAAAILAIRRSAGPEGAAIAVQGLSKLSGDRRTLFLPFAAELYLGTHQVEEARRCVEDYRRGVAELGKQDQAVNERLALLDGAVAIGEGKPYLAVRLLEEVSLKQVVFPQIWKVLGWAYARTEQSRRAQAAWEAYLAREPGDRPVRLALARQYQAAADYAKALQHAREAEKGDPADVEAKRLRLEATLLGGAGKLSDAELSKLAQEVAELRQAQPDNADVRLLAASIADRQGRVQQAQAELEQTVQEGKGPAAAALRLAELEARTGQAAKAVDVCKSAITHWPDEAGPRLMLATLHAQMGQKDEVQRTFREAVSQLSGEEKADATVAWAKYLVAHGDPTPGVELLRQLALERREDVTARLALLDAPLIQRNLEESQRLVDEIKRIDGDRGVRWRFEQARVWFRDEGWKDRQDDIAEILGYCLKEDPGWSRPVILLGRMYEGLGRDDKAEEAYKRFFEVYPGHAVVVSRLLELLERQGRFSESARILERIPGDVPALSAHQVKVAIGQGDYASALDELQRRVADNPNDASARVLLARLIHAYRKDAKSALEQLDEAAKVAPDLLSLLSSRVAILHAEGRDDEVVALLNAEVARRKDFPTYLLRAEFYAAVGRMELAEKDFRYLTTFPELRGEAYGALGRFYQRAGRKDEATATWEAGLKVDPNNLSLKRSLMGMLISSSEAAAHARGRGMLDDLLKHFPNDPALLSVKAADLLNQGTPEATQQAVEALERVVQLNPGEVVAHKYLIDLARSRGELTRASQLAARALGANHDNVDLLLARAELEDELSNVLTARELAQSAVRLDAKNVAARNLLVRMALRNHDLKTAETLSEEALKLDPGSEEAQVVRADVLNAKDQRGEAIRQLESFRRAEGSRAGAVTLLALVDLYRMEGDFRTAEDRLSQIERQTPSSLPVLLVRLKLLASQRQFDAVLELLAGHCKQHPDEWQALVSAASILVSAGAIEHVHKLKPMFDQFIAANPNRVEGYLGLAMVTSEIGELEDAVKAYRKLLELAPYHQQALNNLAWILGEDLRRPDEALDYVKKGVQRYPTDPHMLNTRGVVYFRLDMLNEAVQDLTRCLAMVHDVPSTRAKTLLYLGRVYLRQGSLNQARSALTQALDIDRQYKVLKDKDRAEIEQLLKPAS